MEDLGERPKNEPGVEALGGGRSPGRIGCTAEDAKAHLHHPCEKGFETQEGLRYHVLPQEKEEPDEGRMKDVADCGGSQFSQVEGEERKQHLCEMSEKVIANARKLRRHRRVHTVEKPHACAECGKLFSQVGDLNKHLMTHTGEKPHTCEWCGKGFAQSGNLKTHRRVHTREKPHACSECGKRFSTAGELKSHLLTHTGEKTHTCELCGKGFARSGDLKKHRRVHTGEKPYACAECGKRFANAGVLKTHLLTHTGEKTHTCELWRSIRAVGRPEEPQTRAHRRETSRLWRMRKAICTCRSSEDAPPDAHGRKKRTPASYVEKIRAVGTPEEAQTLA